MGIFGKVKDLFFSVVRIFARKKVEDLKDDVPEEVVEAVEEVVEEAIDSVEEAVDEVCPGCDCDCLGKPNK